jgi:hypothetical protein
MPTGLGLYDHGAPFAGPIEVFCAIARATKSDLVHLVSIHQPFLERASKDRAMRDLLTKHFIVDVGVSVDVDQGIAAAARTAAAPAKRIAGGGLIRSISRD